jgi:uncharacterized protein (DUF1501 family)
MTIIRPQALARREFLKRSGALSLATGVASPFALNLAAMGQAAALTATDYKAIVCVFMFGGNDCHNMLVPYDTASYSEYARLRGAPLSRLQSDLAAGVLSPSLALPDARQMALVPEMASLLPLFTSGRLAPILNIGPLTRPTSKAQYQAKSVPLPPKLFSHNDQQSIWQSSKPEGSVSGWGGRLGELFLSNNTNATFTSISVSGNTVYLAGDSASQYQLTTNGSVQLRSATSALYGSSACQALMRSLVTQSSSQTLENEHAKVMRRALDADAQLRSVLPSVPAFATTFDPANSLALQLKMVAQMIAANGFLGAKRQVFFVSLGGFDLHDNLAANHPALLSNVAQALSSFDAVLQELGASDKVLTFTASDFGRTLTTNGNGSDHGWGSHHFVMGGKVNGGRFFGTAPMYASNGPDDVGQGRLLPAVAVDQFAATLATWFGVPATDLPLVVPQISEYSLKDLGFVRA